MPLWPWALTTRLPSQCSCKRGAYRWLHQTQMPTGPGLKTDSREWGVGLARENCQMAPQAFAFDAALSKPTSCRKPLEVAASRKVCAWVGKRGELWAHFWLNPKGTLVCRRSRVRSVSTQWCCPVCSSKRPKAGGRRLRRDSSWWTSAVKPCSR